jgi:hypothetical protein
MSLVQTDPDIRIAIISYLQGWQSNSLPNHDAADDIDLLTTMQMMFGWKNFFEGWIPIAWVEAQQAYYSLIC